MEREKVLVKNTAIITIGKICAQMISFFLLPLYTAVLTTEEYGIVDLLNTLVFLLLPIVTLQVEQALFRYLIDSRNNEQEMKKIISTTIFSVIVQSLIFLLVFIIVSRWIHNEYKFFLAINVIAAIFSSIMLQIARGLGDNKNYALGSFMIAVFTIILNVVFIVIFKLGAFGMLLSSFGANIICIIYIFVVKNVYQYLGIKEFDGELLRQLWKYSIPLIPNALSWWVFNSSDRIIVSSILGMGANGILAVAHKFSNVYITIYNVFNIAWTETAVLHIEDEDNGEFFSKVNTTVFEIFSCACLAIIAFMPFIFPIMMDDAYKEAYNQIPILMIASLANVGIGLISTVYISKKKTLDVAKTAVGAAIINIVVNLSLISFTKLYAASISTLVAYIVMLSYRWIDVKKYLKLDINGILLLNTLIMIVILCISYYINNNILNIIMALVVIVYSIKVNKKNLQMILKTVIANKFKKK